MQSNPAKHIGIVACSAEGAALCYRTICAEAPALMGEHRHPEITMHTPPFDEYLEHIRSGEWEKIGELMAISAGIVARAGADFAICPDNTIHQAFARATGNSPIPWLHIAEAVQKNPGAGGWSHLGILGTKYLMTGPVYSEVLGKIGINWEIPEKEDREKIDRIIFQELINGVFPERSRLYFNEVIQDLRQRGCEAVVLGCTEIPLLVDPHDCPLPTLDSTRLLARAALRKAVGKIRPPS